jgi:carboxypeptidase Taq
MPDSDHALFERLSDYARQTALLDSVQSLLGWDERTMMPAAGAEHRAKQVTLLSGMIHARWVAPEMGAMLRELAGGPLAVDRQSDTGATVRRLLREHERRVKLPRALVEELARTAVLGQQAWQKARQDDDFDHFRPWLEKTVELKRQEADALGYSESYLWAFTNRSHGCGKTWSAAAAHSENTCIPRRKLSSRILLETSLWTISTLRSTKWSLLRFESKRTRPPTISTSWSALNSSRRC